MEQDRISWWATTLTRAESTLDTFCFTEASTKGYRRTFVLRAFLSPLHGAEAVLSFSFWLLLKLLQKKGGMASELKEVDTYRSSPWSSAPLISPKTGCSSNVVIFLCLKACLARGEFASLLISGRRWWSNTGISSKEKFWMCQVCPWCLHKGASSVEWGGHEFWNLTDLDLDLASAPHQLYTVGRVTYYYWLSFFLSIKRWC